MPGTLRNIFWFEAGGGGVASGVRFLSSGSGERARECGYSPVRIDHQQPRGFATRLFQLAASGWLRPNPTSRHATHSATRAMHERCCLQGARNRGSGRPAEEAASGNPRERQRRRGARGARDRGLGGRRDLRRSARGAGRTRCTWSTLAVSACLFIYLLIVVPGLFRSWMLLLHGSRDDVVAGVFHLILSPLSLCVCTRTQAGRA